MNKRNLNYATAGINSTGKNITGINSTGKKNTGKSSKSKNNAGKNIKMNNVVFLLLVLTVAVAIMAGILAGAYYFIVNNNIYGIADKYRKEIQSIPALKWALPAPSDPDDPEYLTDEEISSRYAAMKDERDKFMDELEEANRLISELMVYKEGYERITTELAGEEERILDEKKMLEEQWNELQKFAALGDKEGFRKYFETVGKDTAEEIYREIMLEAKQEADIKSLMQIYENMDEAAAAKILSEMGEQKIHLVVEILLRMKKENASAVLGSMDASFASKITEKMADALLKTE